MANTTKRMKAADFDKATRTAQEYLKKNPIEESSYTSSRIYDSSRTHPVVKGLAWAGGISVVCLSAVGIYALSKTEAAESVGSTLCEITETVGDESCSVDVPSKIQVSSKFDPSTLVDSVVVHELRSTGEVREGIGANSGLVALVVEVDTVAGKNYESTELSNLLGTQLDASTFFDSFRRYAQDYDVPVSAVAQGCANEFENLMEAIRDDSQLFATDAIPAKELINPDVVFHRTDFAPFTDIEVPAGRQEVIFVHNEKVLICPEP